MISDMTRLAIAIVFALFAGYAVILPGALPGVLPGDARAGEDSGEDSGKDSGGDSGISRPSPGPSSRNPSPYYAPAPYYPPPPYYAPPVYYPPPPYYPARPQDTRQAGAPRLPPEVWSFGAVAPERVCDQVVIGVNGNYICRNNDLCLIGAGLQKCNLCVIGSDRNNCF